MASEVEVQGTYHRDDAGVAVVPNVHVPVDGRYSPPGELVFLRESDAELLIRLGVARRGGVG